MNKQNLIQVMQEATQRAVGENRYSIGIVYSRIAEAVIGLHNSFLKNHVKPLVSESAMKELLAIDFVTLPKSFTLVMFTTRKGITMKGIYKGSPIDLFVEDKPKWKVWRKAKEIKSKEVKGWHYV